MQNIKDIEEWLTYHDIKNYSISENLQIKVYGSVNLKNKLAEKKLPIVFESINGYFDISENNLESLEGCPNIVQKDFNCSNNNLASLFGAPHTVGDFDCSRNRLKDLSYSPKKVEGYFNCSDNYITSINGSPRTIKGYFKCSNNSLSSLKGGPKYIQDFFDCSNNKIEHLVGGPVTVGQDYICHWNELRGLEDIANEILWDIITDISLNHIPSSSFDEEKKTWRYKGKEVIRHIYKPIVAITNKDDISKWLHTNNIKNFKILEDNSVDVQGDVRLSNTLENLLKLPINFNEVHGDFDISDNVLTSLEGSPQKVTGDFLAYKNELQSLKGGPKEVGKNFVILKNNIRSLINSPSTVGDDFICSHNPLTTLEGLTNVGGSIFTSVFIPTLAYKEFSYHSILTYKYTGAAIMEYLDKEYITLTEEEKIYLKTKQNLENVISKMIKENALKIDMINDTLLKNLTKYNLIDLKKKVLLLKEPKKQPSKKELSEEEILQSVFDLEI
ncbi:hypothetical protein [Arcobacter sp. LA11]|uniref:hypothetical protein n=1 Tax=Arcobacter sp. LA11 TaxID=1898176 RepID=UPI000934B5C5|nr:hypothetical protein [Arcobacter sp. LA11]